MLPRPYRWKIHLRTMSDGEPHPAAQTTVLSYTFATGAGCIPDVQDTSITDSRLAVLRGLSHVHTGQIVVWDWTTGQILLVRRLLAFDSTLMRTAHQGAQRRILPLREAC